MTAPVNVICMKWGSMYGPEYVNHLRASVKRHLARPHRFVCFTDDGNGISSDVEVMPLPDLGLPEGQRDLRWRKLAVFREDLFDLRGTTLFLDLDLVVVDSLEPFFSHPGRFLIIRDDDLFRSKPLRKINPARDRFLHSVGNSSVFRFEIGQHRYILDAYLADPKGAAARYEISQQFQTAQLAAHGDLSYWPRGWCVSFKNDCVPRGLPSWWSDPSLPSGAKIVVFAGAPKMSEVLAGGGHKWYRRIGNVDWLRAAWQ
ncbi:glycosyltransferase [Caldimonas sp. KR1-144]|uniref:glycosyltransferase n=1 Tax=Caldimonas sp. KR1-144 TaxID=3400911 RepID=UPI003C047670